MQKTSTEFKMDQILDLLCNRIIMPEYTDSIRDLFPDLLLLIVTKALPIANVNGIIKNHQHKCVALAKLANSAPEILK